MYFGSFTNGLTSVYPDPPAINAQRCFEWPGCGSYFFLLAMFGVSFQVIDWMTFTQHCRRAAWLSS
jgi:hypothetical protein